MKLLFILVGVLCFVGFGGSSIAQSTPPRTALVMGVGDYGGATYKGKTIPNLPGITTADVPQMVKKLKALGFTVTEVSNPTLSEAKSAVDAFSAKIKASPGVSLFYFSGHGGEYEGKNFLIPKKASIGSKADLGDEALSAQRVLNGMEESGAEVNLVFLDCCREDLGKSVGGAEMAPLKAKGSFIGFATRSGDFADPGEEGSPYTRFLLKHMDKPGISVADMYASVIGDVKKFSKEKLGEERRPGFYSELDAPFYFVPVSLGTTGTRVLKLPIIGGLLEISEISSGWSLSKKSVSSSVGDQPSQFPLVRLKLSGKSQNAYLRALFLDNDGKIVGEPRIAKVVDGKLQSFDKDSRMLNDHECVITASSGLQTEKQMVDYLNGQKRWSVELTESVNPSARADDWSRLVEFPLADNEIQIEHAVISPANPSETKDETLTVTVGGEVRSPGYLTWSQDITLWGAIQKAEGVTEFSNLKRVILIRNNKKTIYDLSKITGANNPKLLQGDSIVVTGK